MEPNGSTQSRFARWLVSVFRGMFIAMAGAVVGGISGFFLSAWLCILIVFQTLPWKANSSMDQAGLLILPVGMLGGLAGAVFGGRWLYLRVLRPFAARPDSTQTIAEYKEWKQGQPGCAEETGPVATAAGKEDRT